LWSRDTPPVSQKLEQQRREHRVTILAALDRRSKKRCAADAGKFAAAFTTNAGDGRAISVAGIGKFISIFKCAV
jgi:hypothetical protein